MSASDIIKRVAIYFLDDKISANIYKLCNPIVRLQSGVDANSSITANPSYSGQGWDSLAGVA
jgi:hypothetical protein